MKPRLILAAIAGGMSGVAIFSVTKVGLVATPSPGSIFAYLAETPRGSYFGVLLGVIVSAGVSLTVASALLGFGRHRRRCRRPRGRSRTVGGQQAGLEADPGRRDPCS